MKKSIYLVFLSAGLLASCQDGDLLNNEKLGTIGTQEVGIIDPAQDFNLATRASIFVSPSQSQEIKIYMKSGNSWNQVADYQNVTEACELSFDVQKGTREVFVTDGIQAFNVELGGSVAFVGTRAGSFDVDKIIKLNEGNKYPYQYYDETIWNEMLEKLPEGKRNRDITIHNFSMISTGPFVVYPFYWNCQAMDYIGIYWRDSEGNLVEHNLFGNHIDNECVQMWDNNAGIWNSDLMDGDWNLLYDEAWSDQPYAIKKNGFAVEGAEHFRSKGVVVDLPVGTVFGFYIDPRYYGCYLPYNYQYLQKNYSDLLPADFGEYKHYYSDANLNPLDCIATPDGVYGDSLKYCFATYVDKNGHVVVAGDDGVGGYKNKGTYRPMYDSYYRCFDFNDIAFNIFGEQPTVLSNQPQEWLLAFEDNAVDGDLDFNDIVLKMSYASGSRKAYITPLAAGGKAHSVVMFNDTDRKNKAQTLGEVHVLLGADELPSGENYLPINTRKRGSEGKQVAVNITTPQRFSIANAQNAAAGTSTQSVLGLYVVTEGKDGNSIVFDGSDNAPAMLVLPSYYDMNHRHYEWAWPTENTSIADAYAVPGHSFAEWANGSASAADWYMYPSGKTVDEKSYLYADPFANPLTAEYVMKNFGTVVTVPAKNRNGNYDFGSMIRLSRANIAAATITVVLKGVDHNALVATGTNTPLGTWYKMELDGTFTEVGSEAGLSGKTYEGVYHIVLSSAEMTRLNTRNWSINCGENSEVLYAAFTQKPLSSIFTDFLSALNGRR